MAVTLTQVADAAGCSVPTVSRAFRNPGLVADETRDRILAAARQLGYKEPRSRLSRTDGTLGLVVSGLENPFFPTLIKALLAAARQRRLRVYLANPDSHPEEEADLVNDLTRQVDALLLWAPTLPADQLRAISGQLPTVVVNNPTSGCVNLLNDVRSGMRQAVEHLSALGHQRCGFVLADGQSWTISQRAQAVREACSEAEIDLTEFGPYDSEFDSGVQAADLAIAAGVTAIIATNDITAQGVLRQLTVRGVRVPDDISLVGVDDTILAQRTLPTLTTVHVPIQEIAARAVAILAQMINDSKSTPRDVVEFQTRLVVRDSTRHPRLADSGRPPQGRPAQHPHARATIEQSA
jgi:DNA-binding LacI/PurR family transcriptional regulator